MSRHNAVVEWEGPGAADFLAGHYSRGHTIRFDAGASLAGSASPSVVKAPWSVEAAADPEEMLVASISACHMLWFLDFAKRAGVAIRSYRDEPEGRMGRMPNGAIGVATCVLRPAIEAEASPETLAHLHHQAHEACNIANSVLTVVTVEPVLEGALAHG